MHEKTENEPQILPIRYWFVVRIMPWGTAPQAIKKQWIDIPLPCRRPLAENQEEIVIDADDAIKALMLFDRADAGSWYNNLFGGSSQTLIFRSYEGQTLSNDVAELALPGINQFDEYVYWL